MRSLLKYLRGYKRETVLSPLFKFLEAVFELLIPLVVAGIIDRGINAGDRGYVIRMVCLMVLLGAVGFGFSVTGQYFAAKSSAGFGTGVREAVFRKIQGMSYSDLDGIGTPTLINRLTADSNQAQSGLNILLRLVLRSPFIVIGSAVMTFTINVPVALIFTATILVLAAVMLAVVLSSVPVYKRSQAALDRVTELTRENLTGVRVLRAFRREEDEIREFDRATGRLAGLQRLAGRISAVMNPATYVIINAALIIIIRSGALKVNSGAMTQGQIIALYNYMAQMLVELLKLANLIVMLSRSYASAQRIAALLGKETGEPSPSHAAPPEKIEGAPRVEFRDVSVKYGRSPEESLSGVSFKAYPGDTVGIIGGTGSGKSTLVNLIPRFYDCTSGTVLIDGADVKDLDINELRMRCGVVPQKAVLFKGTLRDNLRWGDGSADDGEMTEALRLAEAGDVLEKLGGLDAPVEQYGRNLSGGQRQRVTIARALVRRPEILILDDSGSALDYATDSRLRASLSSLDYRPTTFIISQRTSSVMNADLIIVLEDGEVVGAGKHDELYASCPVYREIHDVQFGEGGEDGE